MHAKLIGRCLPRAAGLLGALSGALGCDVVLPEPVAPPEGDPEVIDPGEEAPLAAPPERLFPIRSADKAPPALSGGTLVLAPDEATAVAADPDRDLVYAVGLTGGDVTRVTLAQGAEPGRVAFDAAGRAHVILRGTGQLARIDVAAGAVDLSTDVCRHPRGLAHHPDDDTMLVACASGELVTLTASTHDLVARDLLEPDLRDVVVSSAGQVLVSRFRSAELLEVKDGVVVSRARPPAAQVERFDPDASEIRRVTMTPAVAWRALKDASGQVVVVHQRLQEDEVRPSAGGYGGDCGSIVETTFTTFEGASSGRAMAHLSAVTLGVDAAFSPDGQWVAVASPGSYLRAENSGTGTVQIYRALAVEEGDPMCGTFPEVMVELDAQATALAFDGSGKLLVQTREPAELHVYELSQASDSFTWLEGTALTDSVPLDASSVRDSGHDLFHADVGATIACASCHAEGLDDAHTWDFAGIGPRRTQSIRGGILGSEPFHWDGDMKSFPQLAEEVMVGRMSGFALNPPSIDALASWIDQLPALTLGRASDEAAARGEALFRSPEVGCTACHSGEFFTNNRWADVGTGALLQVPTLRGLGLRAPYMHDGCAKTLKERFEPACGGTQHGQTEQLSEAELADLIAYLETL